MRIFYPVIVAILLHCLTVFVKQLYVLYASQQRDVRVSYFVYDAPYDSYYQLRSRIYAEHALAYAMVANAGVVKAIVSFYRIDSARLSNDLEAVYR